ncbi:unnamed protein product [Protopolystoma xenopodis]|uniref:Uncharacterized protein n=1 Tax=Protopolystoma xenopodis TaxID=117903 RepID=A0A448XC78_9PLAT|nr:unnamed protein product [Protopolystoma xenopodis]
MTTGLEFLEEKLHRRISPAFLSQRVSGPFDTQFLTNQLTPDVRIRQPTMKENRRQYGVPKNRLLLDFAPVNPSRIRGLSRFGPAQLLGHKIKRCHFVRPQTCYQYQVSQRVKSPCNH